MPGAVNISHDVIREHLEDIPRDKPLVLYCAVGLRGYLAERVLRQHGFEEVYNLSGGYHTYSLATMNQSNEDIFSGYHIDNSDTIYSGS